MLINQHLIDQLSEQSHNTERKRINYNFHQFAGDLLQRMLNILQPGSYVQPHRHFSPAKREAFILLQGRLLVTLFNELGKIEEQVVLERETGNFGIEIAPETFHCITALEPNTTVYEVKDGPYDPADDKEFASWAPSETEPELAQKFLNSLLP